MMIDMELATTNQLLGELAKRDVPFIFLMPPHEKSDTKDAAQIHIYGMGPEECLHFLGRSGSLIHEFMETGEMPPGTSFFMQDMDEDGNVVREIRGGPLRIGYEEEEDCWDVSFEDDDDEN